MNTTAYFWVMYYLVIVSSVCAFLIAMSIEMVPRSWKYYGVWVDSTILFFEVIYCIVLIICIMLFVTALSRLPT